VATTSKASPLPHENFGDPSNSFGIAGAENLSDERSNVLMGSSSACVDHTPTNVPCSTRLLVSVRQASQGVLASSNSGVLVVLCEFLPSPTSHRLDSGLNYGTAWLRFHINKVAIKKHILARLMCTSSIKSSTTICTRQIHGQYD
jgi:hypothetical protein